MPIEENPYIVPNFKALNSGQKFWVGQRCISTLSLWIALVKISILLHKMANKCKILHLIVCELILIWKTPLIKKVVKSHTLGNFTFQEKRKTKVGRKQTLKRTGAMPLKWLSVAKCRGTRSATFFLLFMHFVQCNSFIYMSERTTTTKEEARRLELVSRKKL